MTLRQVFSNQRAALACALVASSAGLAIALVLQYGFDMLPCPLCVLQRMALCAVALVSIIGLVLPGSRRAAAAGALGGSLVGAGVAVWHLITVYVPSEEATCGPGLGTWVDHLWVTDLAPWLFAPMGDCIKDAASIFGFPLPAAALCFFLGLSALLAFNFRAAKR
ncbi:disulfide bond formation protein B [compost metagenome]